MDKICIFNRDENDEEFVISDMVDSPSIQTIIKIRLNTEIQNNCQIQC